MKKRIRIYLFAVVVCFIIGKTGYSQEHNKQLIVGTWEFKRIEFLRVFDDSVAMKEKGVGMITTFIDSVNFIVRLKTAKGTVMIDSGRYRISANGSMIQQEDSEAVIVTLNETELVFRVEGVFVLYYVRRKKEVE
ncbi:hypothetical protein ESA94_15740 [Lacibacter luteus]|uniref:Lipocalin-like domain-containing protein n=1 Tax=Lacibacter luteus TaxID=2508719 RepID=A0A4Q1CGD6_9BACT|nr:hypothetical protein [Lacibacter luteus]RXK58840.1 hypothetical protein ESA94_15740 [Lacibacter luteus]